MMEINTKDDLIKLFDDVTNNISALSERMATVEESLRQESDSDEGTEQETDEGTDETDESTETEVSKEELDEVSKLLFK